ncbi:hypothetical protein ACGFZK_36480 [Streptomyces sp. NPDC048257]|uniref:hypothetical protein n=1 Tax=Streptomyces sp. NPDC048257 TaxID=3365526 RepID=UPI0037194A79
MIVASIDPTSQAFAIGEVIGVMSAAATAIAALWWLTRSWRTQSTPPGGDPVRALQEKRKRNGFIAGVTVLIVAAASVEAAASYDPDPRASKPRASEALAADGSEESLVIVLPMAFGDFRLMTGAAATRAETEVLAGRELPHSMRTGYYDQDADESFDLFVLVNSADWDPKVAEDKATKSISQEFHNYFTATKARDVARFDAGEHGGGLACGFVAGPDRDQVLCAWSDATNFVGVRLVRETDLAGAARTTLALRNAATR